MQEGYRKHKWIAFAEIYAGYFAVFECAAFEGGVFYIGQREIAMQKATIDKIDRGEVCFGKIAMLECAGHVFAFWETGFGVGLAREGLVFGKKRHGLNLFACFFDCSEVNFTDAVFLFVFAHVFEGRQ